MSGAPNPPTSPAPIGADTDPAPLRIAAPGAMAEVLHAMLTQHPAIALYAPDAQAPAAPLGQAQLAALDAAGHRLALQAMPGTAGLPEGESGWLCVTVVQGLKVQFTLHGAWRDGRLDSAWPDALLRLQRRRHVRVDAPLGQSYRADFLLDRRAYALSVDDLSLGGVGLRATPQESATLYVGRKLRQVMLELGDGRVFRVDLEVRSRRKFNSFLLGDQVHIGCSFVQLPAAVDEQLRAAIDALARERGALPG